MIRRFAIRSICPTGAAVEPYPSVKVRMDFRDPNIVGTFVYHCHILQHEDGGMMGEIQVLPSSGLASATTATASASSITPNGNITLTANVVDASTGASTPTGTVQFQLNGFNVGAPVTLTNGQATLNTTINGITGANNLTAFYQGDATYTESISAAVPITISNFALSSPAMTAPLGSAAIAPVTVNVATNYTIAHQLSPAPCPPSLTESACFVDPNSMTGTGQVSLTVNTTPAHPLSSKLNGRGPDGSPPAAALVLHASFCFALPRRRWRSKAMIGLSFLAILFTVIGCGGTGQTDPGTAKGNLHRRRHRHGRQWIIAVPDQRERSDHDPVGAAAREIRRGVCRRKPVALQQRLRMSFCAVAFLSAALLWASVGGSISGTVKDPSGRVVPDAQVTVRQMSTGLAYKTHSDSKGYYTFPVLPVGQYELDVQATGFSGYQRNNVALDTNAAITLDVSLEVGSVAQTVSVSDNTLACRDREHAAWPGDHREADDRCAARWTQLYRPAFAAAGSGPANDDYFHHRAGCGRHRPESFGNA